VISSPRSQINLATPLRTTKLLHRAMLQDKITTASEVLYNSIPRYSALLSRDAASMVTGSRRFERTSGSRYPVKLRHIPGERNPQVYLCKIVKFRKL
jgi:hypothetical protein